MASTLIVAPDRSYVGRRFSRWASISRNVASRSHAWTFWIQMPWRNNALVVTIRPEKSSTTTMPMLVFDGVVLLSTMPKSKGWMSK
jgi:hypothetical protein